MHRDLVEAARDDSWQDAISVWATPVALLSTSPCKGTVDPSVGRTADDQVRFLVEHPGLQASDPVPVTIGGRPGTQVDIDLAPGWTSDCPDVADGAGFVPLFGDAKEVLPDGTIGPEGDWWGPGLLGEERSDPLRIIVLDLGDEDVAVIQVASAAAKDQPAFIERAMPIVESLRRSTMTARVVESRAPVDARAPSRNGASRTTLPDGRVLVAGGHGPSAGRGPAGPILDTAELWDPATGTSTPTQSLVVARTKHTATLLQDGRVLLVGSHTHGPDDPAADVFQPVPRCRPPGCPRPVSRWQGGRPCRSIRASPWPRCGPWIPMCYRDAHEDDRRA